MRKKFETPILRLVTTADGPVCFDIKKESEQINNKEDLLNTVVRGVVGATVPTCLCQCTCECTSPCNCQCTCECIVPCTCQCTCECQCETKSGETCFALTVENDPLVEIINPIEKMGQRIRLSEKFMLRKESFGGLLFDKQYFVSYFCNHTAWEILNYIEKRKGIPLSNLKSISDHLKQNFESTPENIEIVTFAFIHGCMKRSTRRVLRE